MKHSSSSTGNVVVLVHGVLALRVRHGQSGGQSERAYDDAAVCAIKFEIRHLHVAGQTRLGTANRSGLELGDDLGETRPEKPKLETAYGPMTDSEDETTRTPKVRKLSHPRDKCQQKHEQYLLMIHRLGLLQTATDRQTDRHRDKKR
jgi:hypothetical protein